MDVNMCLLLIIFTRTVTGVLLSGQSVIKSHTEIMLSLKNLTVKIHSQERNV